MYEVHKLSSSSEKYYLDLTQEIWANAYETRESL